MSQIGIKATKMSINIFDPSFEYTDQRGTLREIVNGKTWESINHHYRIKGCKCGGHYHKITEECFYIVSGLLEVELRAVGNTETETIIVPPGKGLLVPTHYYHNTHFLEDTNMITMLSKAFDKNNPDTYK